MSITHKRKNYTLKTPKQKRDLQQLISYTKMSGLRGWQPEHMLRLLVSCPSLLRRHHYSYSHRDGERGMRRSGGFCFGSSAQWKEVTCQSPALWQGHVGWGPSIFGGVCFLVKTHVTLFTLSLPTLVYLFLCE